MLTGREVLDVLYYIIRFRFRFMSFTTEMIKKCILAYLGVSHIHNILVSLHTLNNIEAITVQHFGLRIARNHQDDVTGDTVLQGLDLMAEKHANNTTKMF